MKKRDETKVISAKLTNDIFYIKKGKRVVIPKDTEILVDLEKMIALFGLDHFFINAEEYQVISA